MTELKILGPDEKALRREKIVDVLWDLQQKRGYIDDEAVKIAAAECALSPIEVDEVATFYNLLLRRPAGRRQIYVCDSISCELTGAKQLIAEIEKQLGAKMGEITADGEFGLLPIVCLGHCDMAPCLMANRKVHGPLQTDPESVRTMLDQVRRKESQ
jgi:NADH-quinone oxidoreductase subunit E